MKTFVAKPLEVVRDWYIVDAEDKVLGRLAAQIAHRLRGKHKPEFTPNCDTGDYIVVINAEKIGVTGTKRLNKMYHRHTGYVGNMKHFNFEQMIERSPEEVLKLAVKGMMPKGPLGREMMKKLKIYAGSEHPHTAQQPKTLDI